MLLEASALGVPIAAMNTGGTPDIVKHGETGLLSSTPEALADDVRRLVDDESLRRQLGIAAALHAERTFDARAVVQRVESLYLRPDEIRAIRVPLMRSLSAPDENPWRSASR